MRQQGAEYLCNSGIIWEFLSTLSKKKWLNSKTQYFISEEEIMDSKITSKELMSEIYSVDDEKYLRYDQTVPWISSLSKKTNQAKVIKRYELGEVFRRGPRKGRRFRNFTQLDLEICDKEKYNTVELIHEVSELFKTLGKNIILKYNDYSLFNGLSFEEKQNIDSYYSKNKPIDMKIIDRFQSIKKDKIKAIPLLESSFKTIFSPELMRGQGIYKDIVFEAYVQNERASLFAGGEYKINNYYCSGLSIGIDFFNTL